MATLKVTKIKTDEHNGVVTAQVTLVREDDEHDAPWYPQDTIEKYVAILWGWNAARMLNGSDMDETCDTRELRFMRYYEWTTKIRVSAGWVADGFNLTAERAHDMVSSDLRFASADEIETEIVAAPTDRAIATEQGYPETGEGLAKFLNERAK